MNVFQLWKRRVCWLNEIWMRAAGAGVTGAVVASMGKGGRGNARNAATRVRRSTRWRLRLFYRSIWIPWGIRVEQRKQNHEKTRIARGNTCGAATWSAHLRRRLLCMEHGQRHF